MSDDNLNKIFHCLGQIQADQASMKEDIAEIKQDTNDYRQTKNRLIGACIFLSTSVGGGVSLALKKFGIEI